VFPEGVQLSAKDERISIYGESPIQWLMDNDIRLRQLSADHRVDISNLSASLSSVATLLKRDFSKRDLAGVTPLVSLINDRLLVEVSGEMPAQSLRLLNTMFARNYWVTVTAK